MQSPQDNGATYLSDFSAQALEPEQLQAARGLRSSWVSPETTRRYTRSMYRIRKVKPADLTSSVPTRVKHAVRQRKIAIFNASIICPRCAALQWLPHDILFIILEFVNGESEDHFSDVNQYRSGHKTCNTCPWSASAFDTSSHLISFGASPLEETGQRRSLCRRSRCFHIHASRLTFNKSVLMLLSPSPKPHGTTRYIPTLQHSDL